jgi:hypothetical protein
VFFPLVLHFFKCILVVQGGFTLAFRTCINRALIRLPPLFTLALLPIIQQLTVHYLTLSSFIDGMFQKFSFSNILFPSPASCSPLRLSNTILCFLPSLSVRCISCTECRPLASHRE